VLIFQEHAIGIRCETSADLPLVVIKGPRQSLLGDRVAKEAHEPIEADLKFEESGSLQGDRSTSGKDRPRSQALGIIECER
jgi:hypothetical protein